MRFWTLSVSVAAALLTVARFLVPRGLREQREQRDDRENDEENYKNKENKEDYTDFVNVYKKDYTEATHSVSDTLSTSSPGVTSAGPGQSSQLQCEDLLSNWNTSQDFPVMLLSVNTKGRFGNELFVTAAALIHAQLTSRPVMLHPGLPKLRKKRQILKLPCIRRALRLPMPHMCPGCTGNLTEIWDDRSDACNHGLGCFDLLWSQKRFVEIDPGYHQNLLEWKAPPLSWRPLLATAFQVDMPLTGIRLPGDKDLVVYYRSYAGFRIFDTQGWGATFLHSPPFSFFDFAWQQHQKTVGSGKLWVVSAPDAYEHPTVLRLCSELGAEIVRSSSEAGKDAWLADWVWLREATYLVISASTFSWWAAYLSDAKRIYFPLFPTISALPWCDLVVLGDTRYLYYDFFTNASFDDGSVAKDHCLEYNRCRGNECPMKKHRHAIANLYPELLALKNSRDAIALRAVPP
eukprot:s1590_g27.t1